MNICGRVSKLAVLGFNVATIEKFVEFLYDGKYSCEDEDLACHVEVEAAGSADKEKEVEFRMEELTGRLAREAPKTQSEFQRVRKLADDLVETVRVARSIEQRMLAV